MDLKSVKAWASDCAKGVIGAIFATLALALLQYIGAHVPDILQFLSKIAGAIGAVKISKK